LVAPVRGWEGVRFEFADHVDTARLELAGWPTSAEMGSDQLVDTEDATEEQHAAAKKIQAAHRGRSGRKKANKKKRDKVRSPITMPALL
jgi:hypothetical protein